MLLLIQRLTQRPKKRSETEKEVVGTKLQSPLSPSTTQEGGGAAAKEDWKHQKSRHATPGCSQQKQRGRLRSSGRLLAIR